MKDLPPKVVRPESKRKMLVTLPEKARDDQPMGVDLDLLKEYLLDNPALIKMGKEIIRRPSWRRDFHDFSSPSFSVPDLSELNFVTSILLAQAQLMAQKGDTTTAWKEAIDVMNFGQRISRSGNSYIETLTAISILRQGARHASWIGQLSLDSMTARRLSLELQSFENTDQSFQQSLRAEFRIMLNGSELFINGGEPLKRYLVTQHAYHEAVRSGSRDMLKKIHLDQGKLSISDEPVAKYPIQENIEKWMKDPPPAILAEIELLKTIDHRKTLEQIATGFREAIKNRAPSWTEFRKKYPKPAANEVAGTARNLGVVYDTCFSQIAQVRLARLSLLLRAWGADHAGKLPAALDELVPAYLSAVPVDPFDGKEIRYDQERRRIWCVGKEFVDEGNDSGLIVQVILE